MISGVRHSILRQAKSQWRASVFSSRAQQILLSRLLSTLAVLEQREGKLNNASLGAVTAAQKLGGSITGFIAGSGVKAVADEAAKVDGLEKILMVENGDYDKVYISRMSETCSLNSRTLGSTGKLRPPSCREHQKGRLYPHNRRPFCLWEEPDAPRCGSP